MSNKEAFITQLEHRPPALAKAVLLKGDDGAGGFPNIAVTSGGALIISNLSSAWTDLTDTPSTISAGLVVQGNSTGTALEFGQALDTTDSPQFVDLVLTGDLTVQGTTTTLDTETLLVEDKNIEMGNVTTPTDLTADGGGITLLGTTNKTIIWVNATDSWTFNQQIDAGTNKVINVVDPTSAQDAATKNYVDTQSFGDVFKVGTPVDNQIGVWTGDGTIEGTSSLTFDGSIFSITGSLTVSDDFTVATSLIFADVSNGTVTLGNSTTGTDRFNVFGPGTGFQQGIASFYDSSGNIKFRFRDEIAATSIPPRLETESALGMAFNTTTDVPYIWYINGTANEEMRLNSTGLGVGTTPVSKLHISEDTNTTGVATGVTIEQTNISGEALLHFKDTFSDFTMGMDTSDDNAFYITPGTSINVNQGLNIDRTTGFVSMGNVSGGSNQLNVAGDINTTTAYNIGFSVEVLSATTLGSGVVNSSLTSVGTLGSLSVTGAATASTFNGVSLTTGGVATNFLDETGNYSVPGGSVTLQDAYDNGQDITTTTALGPVVLDNTGSTRATLQLVPGTVPTTSLVSGQIYSDGNDLYVFDSVRGNFLSGSERFGFGLNGAADNEYMRVGHASDSDAAWIVPYDGTITHITAFATSGLATKGFEIQDESGTVLVSFNLVTSEFDGTQDVDIPAGTHLRSFIVAAGGSVSNSAVSVFVRRRV